MVRVTFESDDMLELDVSSELPSRCSALFPENESGTDEQP